MTKASLAYAKPLQEDDELAQLSDLLRAEGVHSYLEIGARYGGSFERIMSALPAGARGTAVDFPGGAFGDDGSTAILLAALDRLRRFGRHVNVIFGPSAAPEVVHRARMMSPYDAVLIDADHSYEAAALDFRLYGPFARIVILHDIAAPAHVRSRDGRPVEVPRLWAELKTRYRHQEIVVPDSLMGIGVIWMDAPTTTKGN